LFCNENEASCQSSTFSSDDARSEEQLQEKPNNNLNDQQQYRNEKCRDDE